MNNILRIKLLAGCCVLTGNTMAADCPPPRCYDKAVLLLVPFSPGGPNDILARKMASVFSETISQPVVVENRPGGAGSAGVERIARSEPDGHSILFSSSGPLTINSSLYVKTPFDVVRDFSPVSLYAATPLILLTHPSVPAKSVKEFIALTKAKPGGFTVASFGSGSLSHLSGELFNQSTGANLVHVPYKGGGPAIASVVAGESSVTFALLASAMPQVKAGRLKPLAITGASRVAGANDIPTMIEAGVAGYDVTEWYGVLLPARTPPSIVSRLNTEVRKIVGNPQIRRELIENGFIPVGSTSNEFSEKIKVETMKWNKVIRMSNIRAD